MANPKIEVEIGAKTTGLAAGAAKAEGIIKNVGNASQAAAPKVNQLAKATGSYNSVGIEFSRIIQDAPFGIIGVGNNITQLTQSFASLRAQSSSTGAALKTAFASIVTPTNLLVLGISAATTALTLYSQSAASAKSPVNELKEAQDEFNESLKETDRLLGADFLSKLLKDVGLVETQNIGGRLIDVQTFENAQQVVDALSGSIQNLRKGELELLAKFLKTEIAEANRDVANSNNEILRSLASDDLELYQGLLAQINKELEFYKEAGNIAAKTAKDVVNSFTDPQWQEAEDNALRLALALNQLAPQQGLNSDDPFGIQRALNISGPPIKEIADIFDESANRIIQKGSQITSIFNAVGNTISSAFVNAKAGLGNFLSAFISFAGEVIARALAISQANVVAGATAAGAASGPLSPFVTPALIASGLALIASTFAFIGGGKGGGGGSGSGIGSSVNGTSISGVGGVGNAFDISGEFVVRGSDLVYVLDRQTSKNAKG